MSDTNNQGTSTPAGGESQAPQGEQSTLHTVDAWLAQDEKGESGQSAAATETQAGTTVTKPDDKDDANLSEEDLADLDDPENEEEEEEEQEEADKPKGKTKADDDSPDDAPESKDDLTDEELDKLLGEEPEEETPALDKVTAADLELPADIKKTHPKIAAAYEAYRRWDHGIADPATVESTLVQMNSLVEKLHDGKGIADFLGIQAGEGTGPVEVDEKLRESILEGFTYQADKQAAEEAIDALVEALNAKRGTRSAPGKKATEQSADDPKLAKLEAEIDALKQQLSAKDEKSKTEQQRAQARTELREAARRAMPKVRAALEKLAPGFKDFATSDVMVAIKKYPNEPNPVRAVRRYLNPRLEKYREIQIEKAGGAPEMPPRRSKTGRAQVTTSPNKMLTLDDAEAMID